MAVSIVVKHLPVAQSDKLAFILLAYDLVMTAKTFHLVVEIEMSLVSQEADDQLLDNRIH